MYIRTLPKVPLVVEIYVIHLKITTRSYTNYKVLGVRNFA